MAATEHEIPGTADVSLRPAQEHEQKPSTPPWRPRGRLGRWVMGAAVVIVVAALAVVLLGRAGVFGTNPSTGSGGASRSWETYHDSFGLFTLQVPPGWTAKTEPATGGFGDSHGGMTEAEDLVSFTDPTQGTGSARFSVFAAPLKTALAHQTFCRDVNTTLQSFSPRNLGTMEQTGAIWMFTTENASFQIDVAIPGVLAPGTFGHPLPTVAPLPATQVATDKSEVNAMLVSFQPTDPKPLTC